MQTYTVYERRVPSEDVEERVGDLVFVKEGFAFWALVAPPIWLLVHRLWRDLLVYIVLAAALIFALTQLGGGEELTSWAMFVLNLIFAFEARDLYRGSLERRGYDLKSVVSGRNLEESERRFLMEWLPEAKRDRERAALAAASGVPLTGGSGLTQPVPVIGMFPSHGG